jgi:chromosome segregation ATPase
MAKNIDERLDSIDEKIDGLKESVFNVDKEISLTQQTLKSHTAHDEVIDSQIMDKLSLIGDTLSKNTEYLNEHMRRTEAVEELIIVLERRLSPLEIKDIQEKAIKDLYIKIGKIITALAALYPIYMMIQKFF